jgi:hypothetical protein
MNSTTAASSPSVHLLLPLRWRRPCREASSSFARSARPLLGRLDHEGAETLDRPRLLRELRPEVAVELRPEPPTAPRSVPFARATAPGRRRPRPGAASSRRRTVRIAPRPEREHGLETPQSRAHLSPASLSRSPISSSDAPWKTGVLASKPRICDAHPRCVSRICPTFIREGTPSGFSTMSTGGSRPEGRACPPRARSGR